MGLGPSQVVGLDVGTSAVRAAVVTSARSGYKLGRFTQMPLPSGAVVEGEIREADAVTATLTRLRKRAKLPSKKVVIGLGNQRVVVRQVEMAYLEPKEMREAIRFQVAEHIPMAIDDAELDYKVLHEYEDSDGGRMMSVLLVAAATDMVTSFVDAVQAAGFEVAAVDLSPFAVARAVSRSARSEEGMAGAEVIIDVGAGVTSILVHVGGEPRFVRMLLSGGDAISGALETELALEREEAEALKIDISSGLRHPEGEAIVASEVDAFVDELRSSIDYYRSREDDEQVASYVLTGGGSLVLGLKERLAHSLGAEVTSGDPLADVKTKSRWDQSQRDLVSSVIGVPLGLAMGRSA